MNDRNIGYDLDWTYELELFDEIQENELELVC